MEDAEEDVEEGVEDAEEDAVEDVERENHHHHLMKDHGLRHKIRRLQ